MRLKKIIICVMPFVMVLGGCGSPVPTLPPVNCQQAEIPAAAAWAMEPKSDSLKKLNELFSISEPESSATRQN